MSIPGQGVSRVWWDCCYSGLDARRRGVGMLGVWLAVELAALVFCWYQWQRLKTIWRDLNKPLR